ncbi:DUF3889 domain-containing protein [Pseudoneobacillus sp. C159]
MITIRIVLASILLFFSFIPHSFVEAETPAYAKWGRVAMKSTHEKYPKAEIIDYLHIGRVEGNKTSTEKFKLWLKEKNREFGVFVDVVFETKTDKLVKVTFKEVNR